MSNINVTPGTGKTVATETIGGIEYGQVKIIDGAVGSSSVLAFVNAGTAIPVSIMGVAKVSFTGGSSSVVGVVSVSSIVGSLPAGTALIGGITSVAGTVTTYAQPDSYVSGSPSIIVTTASIQVLPAPGSALRNYVTNILVTNAGLVAATVNIVDVGNVIYSGYAAASGGGFSATLPVPLKQPTANIGLYAATSATTSVIVAVSGYKAA